MVCDVLYKSNSNQDYKSYNVSSLLVVNSTSMHLLVVSFRVRTLFQKKISRTFPRPFQDSD